jgi:hypothetical protein
MMDNTDICKEKEHAAAAAKAQAQRQQEVAVSDLGKGREMETSDGHRVSGWDIFAANVRRGRSAHTVMSLEEPAECSRDVDGKEILFF